MSDRGRSVADFFVSYTSADRAWAEWIGWTLEDAGYSVILQAWDFGVGSRFVGEMQRAAVDAPRTIAVMSARYLGSRWAAAEWQAALAADPDGQDRRLLVLRVEEVERPGLLTQVVSEDLFGVGRRSARERLLAAVQEGRRKPEAEPAFPEGAGPSGAEPVFPPEFPTVWNVPVRLAHFVGRESLLDDVDTALSGSGVVTVVAIAGMGGVGKTALALEYVYRHAGQFDAVWWVPAERPELVAEQLGGLAVALGLAPDADWAAICGALHRLGRWLVIFDNAQAPADVAPYSPTGRGRVLVTSRRRGWRGIGSTVDVAELSREESISLLRERVAKMSVGDAGRIAELLGDLALAVEQAAGFLDQTGMPSARYADLLADRLGDLIAEG